jgi:hypothetical protein
MHEYVASNLRLANMASDAIECGQVDMLAVAMNEAQALFDRTAALVLFINICVRNLYN